MTSGHPAGQNRLRAFVQAPQQQRRVDDDDERHQDRTGPGPADASAESRFCRIIETPRLAALGGVALHHRDRIQHFGCDRAGVGHPVLAGARQAPHAPAEPHRRQHHQQQHAHHLQHDPRVGVDQHRHGAGAHDRVAQAHRQRRADDSLHQRGVGRQPRQHLAGLGGFEKFRALHQHMRVHGIAQVGRDPLAQPTDHVKTRRREQPQRHCHAEQRQEVFAHGQQLLALALGRQPAVDQAAQGDREHQRRRGRQNQEQRGPDDACAVGPEKRRQP